VEQEVYSTPADSQTVRRGAPGCYRIFKNIVILFNFYVVFFQTATKLLGQIVIKYFGPNYVIHRSARDLFWPMGTVNRESLEIAALLGNVQTVSEPNQLVIHLATGPSRWR